MPHPVELQLLNAPTMPGATLLLALSGWMDGGLVSTGTVRRIMESTRPEKIAKIESDAFYLHAFPGSMEIAAVFRPEIKIEGGLVERAPRLPRNDFHADASANLVFFLGQEPHMRWQTFADAIFGLCERVGISRILFMGSFGGSVPHTREPRMFGAVSHAYLLPILKEHGLRPSEYEGPTSFATFLLSQCPKRNVEMVSFVAEIPGYLNGINPLSIEAITRRLGKLLGITVDLASLREASNAWEVQVTDAVEKDEELAATVKKLEEQYDEELLKQQDE